jgi:hypothetical protein
MMDERYHDVSKSAKDTFKWIFNEEEQSPSDLDSRNPFKEWLTTGEGIFHISGKPGSGKSTLMKFLCRNDQTREWLQRWAGPRKLVFARFFFWRPGNMLQTSLFGLVRSLLFHVLEQCPETISSVFPQFWNPANFQPWVIRKDLNIDNDEILRAFEEVLKNAEIYTNRRFCFFIDGLDEFKEEFRTYGGLIANLNSWVDASAGGVKICVSSREYHVFQKKLPDHQRIRLHDLTRKDIEEVINQKLEEHLTNLKAENPRDCKELVSQVIDKADGVFLWVALTLKLLCDGLENQYSFSDLFRKLDAIPRELKHFFCHILDSIDDGDRRKAYCTFAVAIEANKFKLNPTLSLFRYSFLADLIDDPDYAKNLVSRNMTTEQIKVRLAATSAQLTGRCRGLLEVRSTSYCPPLGHNIDLLYERVKFTHRSIPEFLEDYLRKESEEYLKDFDAMDAIINTFLAVVKRSPFEIANQYTKLPILSYEDLHALLCVVRDSKALVKKRYFESLHNIETVLSQKQLDIRPASSDHKWSQFTASAAAAVHGRRYFASVLNFAGSIYFFEYISWFATRFPEEIEGRNGVELLDVVIQSCAENGNEVNLERLENCLEECFKHGVDPNCVSNDPRLYRRTIWARHMLDAYFMKKNPDMYWKIAEVFLKFGADPDLAIYIPAGEENDLRGQVTSTFSENTYQKQDPILDANRPSLRRGRSPKSLQTEGRWTTLQGWLFLQQPANAEQIREILGEIEPFELPLEAYEKTPMTSEGEEVFENEKATELAPVMLDDIKVTAWQISLFGFWSRLGEAFQSPVLPWFLFGMIICMSNLHFEY